MESEILGAAMRAFVWGGIEAVTIASIEHEVGTSVGGLYRYFDSKDAILVALGQESLVGFDALQRELLAALEERLTARKAGAAHAALARACTSFSAFLVHAERAPGPHRLLDMLLSTPDRLFDQETAPLVERALEPILGRSSELLDAAAAAGAVRPGDARLRTHAVWAAFHGVDHFKKRDRFMPAELHSQRIAELIFESLFLGWGVEPEAFARARAA
jgi:AcrR family transcriptional regulator